MNARSLRPPTIAAVVAAAGRSRRMGQPKQLLPWGSGTVIQAVVDCLVRAGASPVIVVTGHQADAVRAALAHTSAQTVHNPDYRHTEMLASFQRGVAALTGHPTPLLGTLLALGDQPHIPVDAVQAVLARALETPEAIVVPSHRMRRGHPIYLPRSLWPELLALGPEASLRELLQRHERRIVYQVVDTEAVLLDIDRWADYQALRTTAEEATP